MKNINPFGSSNSESQIINSFFLGDCPYPDDPIQARIIKPTYLTESSFAYDLWKFEYNKSIKKYEIKSLYYEGIRDLLTRKGFFKRYLNKESHVIIREIGSIIDEVTSQMIRDELISYVDSFDSNIEFVYSKENYSIPRESLRDIFLRQSNAIINQTWLTHLSTHTLQILKDSKNKSFVVFENCYVQISKNGVNVYPLVELTGKSVWKEQQIKKNFKFIPDSSDGIFTKFITNVTKGIEGRYNCLVSILGYLIHNYFSPSMGKAVILYDEALTDKNAPQGGTGKGLISNGLKQVRHTTKIDGKQYKSDDKYKFSSVTPSTQIVWFDETNKDFDFKDLFSCLTDGWQVERKYLNKFIIEAENSPKVLICSNNILSNDGGSNKRRQFICELNDYYSRKIITGTEKPIEDEHGILFSEDWDSNQWNLFYSFMFQCVEYYLKNSLTAYEVKNVQLNLLKQRTSDDFIDWLSEFPPAINDEFDIKIMFQSFKSIIGDDSTMQQSTFTRWVKLYANSIYCTLEHRTTGGKRLYKIKKCMG